ncbi:helix-turn-helix domain-containing protein [Salinarimonas ramus]|uniref:helix-turn-helix domain-containing protein n=1 Tax=Salinarimonas ramus TaxID=690164 RepID=UPI001668F56C|nr:helix-turn-helix transcriptional regulator [Salinarimonas ramus]
MIEELQGALAAEKKTRGLTQQQVADLLEVNRSVVNRRVLGRDNLTVRSLAETAWALGYEPHLELRPVGAAAGANARARPPRTSSPPARTLESRVSTPSGTTSADRVIATAWAEG